MHFLKYNDTISLFNRSQSISVVDHLRGAKDAVKEKADSTKDLLKHQAEELGLREPEKEPEPKTTMEMIKDGTQATGDWVVNKALDAKHVVLPTGQNKTQEDLSSPSKKD